jgi:hypothetical protein
VDESIQTPLYEARGFNKLYRGLSSRQTPRVYY